MTARTPLFTASETNAAAARLANYTVRTRRLGGGAHEVLVDGAVVDTIHRGDSRSYATEAYDGGADRKDAAVRTAVAQHDARTNHVRGLTPAHRAYIAGK